MCCRATRYALILGLFAATFGVPSRVRANEEAQVSEAVSAAKADFSAPSAADLATTRRTLDASITRLDQYLRANSQVAEGWRRYLRWEDMLSQLERGDEARVNDLRFVALQYFADQPGLEMAVFREVGNNLRHYGNTLYAYREPDLNEKYSSQLDSVLGLLSQYRQAPTVENASAVALGLKWLARNGQPQKFLEAVRRSYSKPNVFLQIDEEFAVYGVRRNLNEATPIHDNILGTSIRGTGRTVGRLDADLRPSQDRAILDLMMSGTTASRTVGTNRSALIYSTGNTTISGFKRLMIDEHGIKSTPSSADAKTQSKITGIGSTRGGIGGCLVVKIASKKAAESKGQATEIASQKAKARIRERMDLEAARQMQVSNRDLKLKFRDPLVRAGTYPALINISSTDDDLNIRALEAGWTQLGAPNDPPALGRKHAMTVIAHESVVNNAGNTMFSGRTIHDYEIRNEIIRRRGSLPDEMKDDEDRDPWSISFIDDQPIQFQIADGGFQVLIKFRQFTSGERVLRRVNVSAKYVASKEGTRLVLDRQGDIVVRRDGEAENERIPIGEVALRSVLRKKFSKLFKERIEGEGVQLPGKYKTLGKLPLGEYLMENGWAAIGWDMPGDRVADRRVELSEN